jgi:diguanylate cyclase (GGDEF)-like protein/putative nucleotidyltransferase with HDIG domain
LAKVRNAIAGKLERMTLWSVRTKLALGLLLVGLLPLALFALVTLHAAERSLREQAIEEMQRRNEAFAAALESRGRSLLDQAVSHGEWRDFCAAMDRGDVAWIEENATVWVVENFTELTAAQALAPDGTIVSTAGDFGQVSLYQSPVVTAALESGVQEYDLRLIDGRLFLIAAGPIIKEAGENERTHGVIVFGRAIDPPLLTELAAIIGVDELALYEESMLLASSAEHGVNALPAHSEPGAVSMAGRDSLLLSELRDRSGKMQARVGLRVADGAAVMTARAVRNAAIYALVVALAISLLASVVLTRMIDKPLKRLAEGARAIAATPAGQRVQINSRDEFGEVAEAFNSMSQALSQAFARLRQASETDGLTGLLNHRALHEAVEREVARARRYGTPFGVLALDVDDFKLFNDVHGHPAGDRLLGQLAQLLREQTRQADIVGRVGGDEFIVILSETDADALRVIAQHVHRAVAAQPYVTADGEPIPVRASVGLACFPNDGSTASSLIACADASLYASKRRGGDTFSHGHGDVWPAEIEAATFGMLESLVAAVDNLDRYTFRHSHEVTEHALAIARTLGLSPEDLQVVRHAGLLHDVGKIGVPGSILRKPGRLTLEEREVMRQHPLLGEHLIQEIPDCEEVRAAVVSHHERWDGTGYPHGLRGEETPLLGRIIAVADAYAAMTSDRPYRLGLTQDEAIAELRAQAGSQFDPELVELLVADLGQEDHCRVPDAAVVFG